MADRILLKVNIKNMYMKFLKLGCYSQGPFALGDNFYVIKMAFIDNYYFLCD